MSQSQTTEALLVFLTCVIVGLLPGLICGFRLLARLIFRGLLWNNNRLMAAITDILLIVGVVWPFLLFPVAASIVDNRLEYHFPFGGLQPDWVHFAFATFPYLFVLILIVCFIVWLPYAMRVDRTRADRELADRTY